MAGHCTTTGESTWDGAAGSATRANVPVTLTVG